MLYRALWVNSGTRLQIERLPNGSTLDLETRAGINPHTCSTETMTRAGITHIARKQ